MTDLTNTDTCPCRAGTTLPNVDRLSYATCCKPWHHTGHAGLGASPETTMRSRFTAYVLNLENYLLATWHPRTRPDSVRQGSNVQWHGLDVIEVQGSALDSSGRVEFRARFQRGEVPLELHELSSFVQEKGRWFYVDGVDPSTV